MKWPADKSNWLWLKTTMSLAQLEVSKGRAAEAKVVLEPVCNLLTEGFSTRPDGGEGVAGRAVLSPVVYDN